MTGGKGGDAVNFEQLKKARKVERGKMTRTINILETQCAKESMEIDIEVVEKLVERAKVILQKLEEIHEEYGILESDENEFALAEKYMEDCEQKYLEVYGKAKKIISSTKTEQLRNVSSQKGVEKQSNENRTNDNSKTETMIKPEDENEFSKSMTASNFDMGSEEESFEPTETLNNSDVANLMSFKLAFELPKAEVKEFYGNSLDYWGFMTNFKTNVASKLSDNRTRLQYLLQLCKGKANTCIRSCSLLGDQGYDRALEILKKQFGQPHLVLDALMSNLLKRRQLYPGDSEGLWSLVGSMKECQITLSNMGYTHDLDSTSNLLKVQKLLPNFMQAKWVNIAHAILSSREPTFLDMLDFIEKQAEVGSTMFGREMGTPKSREVKPEARPKTYLAKRPIEEHRQQRASNKCVCCGNNHRLWECQTFKTLSVEERWQVAKRERLCFKCLGSHLAKNCTRQMKCNIQGCTSDHNRWLHKTNQEITRNTESARNEGPDVEGERSSGLSDDSVYIPRRVNRSGQTYLAQGQDLALRTIPVIVSNGSKQIEVNALLDDGSSQTYINADLCGELGLSGETREVVVSTLNGREERFTTQPVTLFVMPTGGNAKYQISALTTKNVTGSLKVSPWHRLSKDWDHLRNINFPVVSSRRQEIDILIGIDNLELHTAIEERCGRPGEPVARLTPLGWTCVGRLSKDSRAIAGGTVLHVNTFKSNEVTRDDTDHILRKFWEIETVGLNKESNCYSTEESKADKIVSDSMVKINGRYSVDIPWNDNKSKLPKDNYSSAQKRLLNLEKKLFKNRELSQAYKKVIDTQLEKGYIRKVDPNEEKPDRQWFLPHFPVVRLDKETTKVRIVYDAAAKHSGFCLNDAIYTGPKLQRNLFDILMRFRKHRVALVCDISEMYLQIEVNRKDREMLRFLWRDLNSDDDPEVYEFCRVVFGVNASPFIAQKVSQHNAELHKDTLPLAAETILKSTYMDDSIDSVKNEKEGIELYHQLTELWGGTGMKARKWLSNCKEVLKVIPQEHRAKEFELNDNDLPSVKTLGLNWDADQDQFNFKGSKQPDVCITKRTVLSRIAAVFDPLGFISPIVARAKILMQEIWASGLDWDEPLTGGLRESVVSWLKDIENLSSVHVDRCLCPHGEGEVELHTFVDASSDAYGAVVYIRSKTDEKVNVQFVASKTRVAPVKSISIPRLELLGAMLGLRLAISVCKVLGFDMKLVYFWSDSMNVLWWIRGHSRHFKPFVANRVGEIQENTNPSQWRHVPGNLNPADVASRGCSVKNILQNEVWWRGPAFLKGPKEEWPETKIKEIKNITEQKRSVNFLSVLSPSNKEENWRLEPNRFSDWVRLVRVLAYVCRFIGNCRSKAKQREVGNLSVDEIRDSEIALVKHAQRQEFSDELKSLASGEGVNGKSQISSLFPKLDSDGVIRATGRLSLNDSLPYDVRCPIILPRKHAITRLIVKNYHQLGRHVAGVNHVLAMVSEKYWVMSAREEIRECENRCNECRRKRVKTGQQIMAPLPNVRTRVDSLRAFTRVAIDYAGPFLTKQGRGKTQMKRYLCLITCLATRAVHLEMAYGLDTDTFLNAFFRFISRRGQPSIVYSDNGSNFIGAERELRGVVGLLDKAQIQEGAENVGIEWNFNPPLTPHFGGAHESLVKSAKRAMYAILSKSDINDEELHSAIVGAEGLLNSRPLTYQTASIKDDVPLTPNHFIHGQMGGRFASEVAIDTGNGNTRKRWRRVQELVRHFWDRWVKEWLPTLNRRNKWRGEKRDLKVDEMVLVMEKDCIRGQWPLGRIVEVFPGPDGHVRVVKVRTRKGDFTRGITKVCPLEIIEE